ncbi:hydantoinase/oxoprolinase family protein [Nordella sp. HKS 07]|uniref:hydantoinase/oxoprolinase family protein n=1 Tax=Nordella sp. HKS 07 TaxID=2712222 RepID=UPI0013E19CF7|nr:hydantoinase/oxoprolinase family protein [Nordella sp. HKS 07]QIG52003.1 hydantoinase/oxoprolinase family protein [Nordella sp. HKS 07]
MSQAQESYFIGVDTGGTYTDAAVIAAADHRVIASAKAITTKGDLAIGVTEAITRAVASLPQGLKPEDISLVSVSTTLATNAVVEGHGSAVGVILAGFDAPMVERTGIAKAFPGMPVEMIAGGHDHNGDEKIALDVAGLDAVLARIGSKCDAFAVAAAFAVRNPAHEHKIREVITARTGKPATLSTELSSSLDAPRRALTAALNARLISRISLLIEAVGRAMASLKIVCPLMIVKGDGTLALAETVAMRPIETVLSGPAASLVGARWLSGLSDFIMSDMGGTTTDLGVLKDGRPRVTEEGAEVGGWRTMVKAIDVRTIGLGGDSEVHFEASGALTIGPQRIVPVSLIAHRFPEVLTMLDSDLADTEGGSMHGRFVVRPFGATGPLATADLSAREKEILDLVTDRPKPVRKVAVSSGAQRALAALKRKGLIQICGFTPSDAAHVLDLQDNWSRPAAEKAARLLVRFREMKMPSPERVRSFCEEVWSDVVRLTGRVILDTALGQKTGGDALLDAVCSGRGGIGLARIGCSPSVPVVAVGGPVKIYYGEVGRRLSAEIVFSEFCDVANAVGAATGVVSRAVTVTLEGDGSGLFRLHGPEGTKSLTSGAQALAQGEALARQAALAAVALMGAGQAEVKVSITKSYLPDAVDDNGLLKADITAEAIGRPDTR